MPVQIYALAAFATEARGVCRRPGQRASDARVLGLDGRGRRSMVDENCRIASVQS